MLRKKGVLVALAVLAFLVILPACDLLNKSESPVGPTSVGDNPNPGGFITQSVSVDWGNNILSEACYALSQARNGSSNLAWNGNVMGDWPYPW